MSLGNQLKTGIHIHLLQANEVFNGVNEEDSIFIMNVELLHMFIFHVVLERWKKIKFTANANFRKNRLSVLCQYLDHQGRVTQVLGCV